MAREEGRVGEEAAGGHEAGEVCVAWSWYLLLLLLCLCGGSVLGVVFFDGESCEVGDGGFDGEGGEVEDVPGEEDGECARVFFCENL